MAEFTLKIRRFDPESGEVPYWQEFDVDLAPERSVLDGILQARAEQDGSIGIRCSCQAAICGSCGVGINGKSSLACNTKLGLASENSQEDDGTIVVEPFGNMPVIKDLIVDMDAVHWKKVQRVVPWLLPEGDPPEREYIVPAEAMIDVTQSMACIHCGACVSACLSLEVGPKDVAPMNQIMRLRRRATGDFDIKDINNGYGHEKAFTHLIETYGTLHEAQLLPRSFGEGSLVRGQTKPAAVKHLVANLPTAFRGLKSGKVNPVKAIIHKKLPDQKQIKRIYNEVESKEERLELNMYIVGETGADEEGALAE